LTRKFVDHQVIHRPEAISVAVVDGGAIDLLGGDQTVGFIGLPSAGHILALHGVS
jgi:hypothetical protein